MTDTINVPLLPTKVMLDAATSHALSVNIGGHYTWSDYMRDLYVLMITSTPAQPAQVQGWQMVPVKITPAMENADPYGMGYGRLHAIWSSLLAAAPKPPVQQCEAPSCGCADAYCKAWDEAPQPSDDAKDAARYRWLREQTWDKARICVVTNPKESVRLGYDCPSTDRLDAAIDAAMAGGEE